MTKRSKPKAPTAAKLARTMARVRVGPVPAGKTVPDKSRRPPKHKKDPRAEA